MRIIILIVGIILTILSCSLCRGQERKDKSVLVRPVVEIQARHNEIDAVGWAFAAFLEYPQDRYPYLRSIYLPWWADAEWIYAVDVGVNLAAGHGRVLVRGDRHAGGHLLVYDLSRLCPDPVKLAKLIATWDEIAIRDPQFHVTELNQQTKQPVAILAPHLEQALARHATDPAKSQRIDVLITQLTRSTGAIYEAGFFLEQALTSGDLASGKYPEFRQYDFNPKQFTPLQNLLRERGFFYEQTKDGGGDKGSFMFRSGVSGKARIVLHIPGILTKVPAFVTFDVTDADRRPNEAFIRNLIEFDKFSKGSEWYIPRPDGLIDFALADGQGKFVRVAPPNLVSDDNKPRGHTKELETGLSCIVCHAAPGEDGYRSVRNDLDYIIGSDADFLGATIEVKGDGGRPKTLTKQQAVDILVGRYAEPMDEPDGPLGRARRDFIAAVDQLTDYPVVAGGPSCVELVCKKIQEIVYTRRYNLVDADVVCKELGYEIPPGSGRESLARIVAKLPLGEIDDPLIPMIKKGASVNRSDMDAIRIEMARRSISFRDSLQKPQGDSK